MPIVEAKMGTGKWSAGAFQIRNVAMHRYAQEFHNAALKTGSPLVRAYLLGHALELYLKVFLLKAGHSTTLLKTKFGHNLVALLQEGEKHGLGNCVRIPAELRADLRLLNNVYSSKSLEYFSVLHLLVTPTLPKLPRMFR